MVKNLIFDLENGGSTYTRVNTVVMQCFQAGLSIRAGSRPKQPATDQPLAGYFRLILLLILVRNLK